MPPDFAEMEDNARTRSFAASEEILIGSPRGLILVKRRS
jgi:hypothetical protein